MSAYKLFYQNNCANWCLSKFLDTNTKINFYINMII